MVRRLFVTTCVILVVATGLSWAATTGRMAGKVLDTEGGVLPGVTVKISSDKLIGGPQVSVAGIDGGFVFNLLPPGTYQVEATLGGFKTASADVRVALDRTAEVTFRMVPEEFTDEVIITADIPVVDTAQVNSSVVFDQEYLQQAAIGSGGRDYLQIISQTAGVAGSGNASVYGGTSGDNSYLIDGLNTSDPLLGTFGTNFNYDAIQEISFQTGGFEAEFGQATGGIINLVTKSGGNEFSGSLDIRYRDEGFIESGEHFDKDAQTSSLRNISGTLGGPIMRDKLWFFVSLESVLTERQSEGAPVVRQFDGWNYIAKSTWQLNDSHRMVFKYSGDPADIPGANSSRFMVREASYTQSQGGDIYQAELNSVLSEAVLLNAQVGFSRGYIEGGSTYRDDTHPAHDNETDGIRYNAYSSSFADDRDRDEYRLNVTFFKDNLMGSHEFKAGIEYNDLFYGSTGYYNGGGVFTDRGDPAIFEYDDINGDGFSNYIVTIKEIERDSVINGTWDFQTVKDEYLISEGDIKTFFVQDSWRPMANLTVKPGIRIDQVALGNHVGTEVADMDRLQPRFGVAYDIFGDSKHVVRASIGRFMDPTALSIPNFAQGVPQIYHEFTTLEYYCNFIGICDAAMLEPIYGTAYPWTSADGFTYMLFDNRDTTVYDPAMTVDQMCNARKDPNNPYYDPDNPCSFNLEAPYADEVVLAYETQIAPETSIELTYINKKTEDIIEDVCSGNTWVNGEAPMPSLEDPTTWTRTDECDFWMIGNIPFFYRDYTAGVFKFETRQDNFHVIASYTWSDSTGNTSNGSRESYATGLGDYFPVHYYNQEGYMPDHRNHRIKLSGYFLLPMDFTLGFDGFWSSEGRITPFSSCDYFNGASDTDIIAVGGDPNAVSYCYTGDNVLLSSTNINWVPRGDMKTKSVWQMDMQVSKSFQIGNFDLTTVLAIYNLFDRELDASFNANMQLTDDYDLGGAVSYWQPRRYELGFRFEF